MPRFLLLSRTVLISSCINLCSFDVKAGKQTFPYYFTDMNFFPKKSKLLPAQKRLQVKQVIILLLVFKVHL